MSWTALTQHSQTVCLRQICLFIFRIVRQFTEGFRKKNCLMVSLVQLYGIVGYLMPNPVFTYILVIWFVETFCRYTQLNDQTVLFKNIQSGVGQLSWIVWQYNASRPPLSQPTKLPMAIRIVLWFFPSLASDISRSFTKTQNTQPRGWKKKKNKQSQAWVGFNGKKG